MISDQHLSHIQLSVKSLYLHLAQSSPDTYLYEGYDQNLTLPLMVKIVDLSPHPASDLPPQALREARFKLEVSLMEQAQSPHLINCIQSGVSGPYHYAVMPKADTTLQEFLQLAGPISLLETLDVAQQVTAALAELYAMPHVIAHRDIKPSNILVHLSKERTTNQSVHHPTRAPQKRTYILSDFGIVLADTPELAAFTETQAGTTPYSAPEQQKDPAQATQASDFYSLGMVLFECLTSTQPTPPKTFTNWELRRGAPQLTPENAAHLSASEREAANLLLDKLTAWNPEKRCKDITALKDYLTTLVRQHQPFLARTMSVPGAVGLVFIGSLTSVVLFLLWALYMLP